MKERCTKLDSSFEPYESSTDPEPNEHENSNRSEELTNISAIPNHTIKRNNLLPSFAIRDPVIEALKEQTQCIKDIEGHFSQQKREDDINSEWRDLSILLDRVFLIIYLLINIVTTLSLILQCL